MNNNNFILTDTTHGRIKSIRLHFNLSQQQFSDKLNISRSNIANIEAGRVKPSRLLLSKIADVFNVNMVWLLTGQDKQFNSKSVTSLNAVDEYIKQYHLPERYKSTLKAFGEVLTEQDRQVIDYMIKRIVEHNTALQNISNEDN